MQNQYSSRSPAVKRLMKEMAELREATEYFYAQPVEENLFNWHFTIRGAEDSEFENGIYHGRMILPPEYPMKPPTIMFLTPNGRFELNKKICLSISGYHPETWQPSWSIRTALLAIIGFMPFSGLNAAGSLDYTPDERKILASRSSNWKCQTCGYIRDLLKLRVKGEIQSTTAEEAKKLASQINFQGDESKKQSEASDKSNADQNKPEKSHSTDTPNTGNNSTTPQTSSSQQLPSVRTTLIDANIDSVDSNSRRESLVAIIVLSVGIAVLLLRRVMLSYFQTSI